MITRLFRQCVYYLHYLWVIAGISAAWAFVKILGRAGQDRTSLSTNREILESLDTASSMEALAIFAMLLSLFVLRRRLKRGVIKRLGIRWQRVLAGIVMPLLVPAYLMRDIDRLAAADRGVSRTPSEIREFQASKRSFLFPAMFALSAQLSSPLNNAFLGIIYVTEGPGVIDDPIRYLLKWISPDVFTTNLDKYSEYIWLGSLVYSALMTLISVIMWFLLNRTSRIAREALA